MNGTQIIAAVTTFDVAAIAILARFFIVRYRANCAYEAEYSNRVTKRIEAVYDRGNTMDEFKLGDLIDIRFATHDGYIWNRAEVLSVCPNYIAVAYPSDTIDIVPHNEGRYRKPISDIFYPAACEKRNAC